ncbi:DUF2207 domain-containing protein [Cellulomonas soli]
MGARSARWTLVAALAAALIGGGASVAGAVGPGAGGATVPGAPVPGAVVPGAVVPDVTSGREITRYDVTVDLDAHGVAHVALDFDFDFGDDPGHGPYLTLPIRQGTDTGQDRLYRVTDVQASSTSGAPDGLDVSDDNRVMTIRVGDEDVDDVQGSQSYRVSYTVDGWVNPANAKHSGDELYWDVIGHWDIPLSEVSVQVTGPVEAEGAACFVGPTGSTTPCDYAAVVDGAGAFWQRTVAAGDSFTVVTGWPGGTFDAEPILGPAYDPAMPWRPVSALGAVGLVMLAVGTFLVVRRVRRHGRDLAYLGLTPGLHPVPGQQAAVGYRNTREPVSVQFTPPADVRPGEMGTLVDEVADPGDVTATLVDLAVRGYLRIEEVPRSNPKKPVKDWTLVQLRPAGPELLPFEARLLDEVFEGRSSVTLSALRTTFASSMSAVQGLLYTHVTARGWFTASPKSVRTRWRVVGAVAFLAPGALLTFVIAGVPVQVPGAVLPALAWALVGIVVMACATAAPARTPAGTAVLAQSMGFRRYLATAEAEQIRFEEGVDIFSRYLPYAIAFGLTDRWARIFAELAARGATLPQPTWYAGTHIGPGPLWMTSFAGSMDRFTSTATTSLTAPTPGSSGGSGFSGGFSGGGVGGGGGGGW